MADHDLKIVATLVDNVSKNLLGMESNFKSFGSRVENIMSTIGKVSGAFAGLMALDKIREGVKASIEYGASIEVNAKKIGMSTRAYQENDFVARQLGTSVENVSRGMRALALESAKNDASFRKFGVTVRDAQGQLLPMNDVFWNTVKRLSQIGNETERVAATQKLFGKNTGEVLTIVNSGADAIEHAREIYHRYGLELSESVIKKMHEAAQAGEASDLALKNLGANVTVFLVPPLIKAANLLSGIVHYLSGPDLKEQLKSVNDQIKNYEDSYKNFDSKDTPTEQTIMGPNGMQIPVYQPGAHGNMAKAQSELKRLKEDRRRIEEEIKKQDEEMSKSGTGGGVDFGGGSRVVDHAYQIRLRIAEATAKADSTSWEKQAQVLRVKQAEERKQIEIGGKENLDLRKAQWLEWENAYNDFLRKANAKQKHTGTWGQFDQISGAAGDKAESRQRMYDRISELSKQIKPSSRTPMMQVLDMEDKQLEKLIEHYERLAETQVWQRQEAFRAAGMSVEAIGKVAEAAHANAGVQKGISMAMAAINTAEAATGALALVPKHPILGWIEFGAIIAAGIAQQAIIAQQKFAGGGIVGGSSYSGDRISAGVNSGEMILNMQQQMSLWRMANGGSSTTNNSNSTHYHVHLQDGSREARVLEFEGRRGGDMDRTMARLLEK